MMLFQAIAAIELILGKRVDSEYMKENWEFPTFMKIKEKFSMNTVKVRNLELGNGIPAICIPNVGKTKEDILSLTRTYLDMHMDLMEWRMDWYEDVEDIAKVTELVKRTS